MFSISLYKFQNARTHKIAKVFVAEISFTLARLISRGCTSPHRGCWARNFGHKKPHASLSPSSHFCLLAATIRGDIHVCLSDFCTVPQNGGPATQKYQVYQRLQQFFSELFITNNTILNFLGTELIYQVNISCPIWPILPKKWLKITVLALEIKNL